jgi:hypothetical protein
MKKFIYSIIFLLTILNFIYFLMNYQILHEKSKQINSVQDNIVLKSTSLETLKTSNFNLLLSEIEFVDSKDNTYILNILGENIELTLPEDSPSTLKVGSIKEGNYFGVFYVDDVECRLIEAYFLSTKSNPYQTYEEHPFIDQKENLFIIHETFNGPWDLLFAYAYYKESGFMDEVLGTYVDTTVSFSDEVLSN